MEEKSVCEAFEKNADGTWTSIRATALKVGNRTIAISQGIVFKKGEPFLAVDVAEWLEEHCS